MFGCSAEFYSFEKACQYDGGAVGHFFGLLGIPIDNDNMLKVNENVSRQAIGLLSYINMVAPLFLSDTSINPIRKQFDIAPILRIKGDKFLLSKEDVTIIEPQVKKQRKEKT